MLRYKTETRPGLVGLYDIRPQNVAGPFLQPRSPHGATATATTTTTSTTTTTTIVARLRERTDRANPSPDPNANPKHQPLS